MFQPCEECVLTIKAQAEPCSVFKLARMECDKHFELTAIGCGIGNAPVP